MKDTFRYILILGFNSKFGQKKSKRLQNQISVMKDKGELNCHIIHIQARVCQTITLTQMGVHKPFLDEL